MRVLVLWAHESSTNLGVGVLARGSRDLLHRVWPEAELTFSNYGARPAEIPWGRNRSLAKEWATGRLGMKRFLAGFDVVWDTRSGDSFADIYGLQRHTTMGLLHEFAVRAGAKAVMAPQTIGPFRTRRARAIARRNLASSELVFARDPLSAEAAARLGRPVDAVSSDLVFAIDPVRPDVRRDVLLNVSGLLWNDNPHVDAAAYRRAVRELAEKLHADGRTVSLLAHVLDSSNPDNDVPAIRELAGELSWDAELVVPTDLDDVRGAIAGASLVIASRMHACLNALSLGVPAVPLAYSRKFAPLLSSIGWEGSVDLTSAADPVSSALGMASDSSLETRAGAARDRGRASLDGIARVLGAEL